MKTAGCIELAELEAALHKWHVGTSGGTTICGFDKLN